MCIVSKLNYEEEQKRVAVLQEKGLSLKKLTEQVSWESSRPIREGGIRKSKISMKEGRESIN